MTKLEQEFAKMTPAQRKRANAAISDMMGMPPKKKTARKPTSTKKRKK